MIRFQNVSFDYGDQENQVLRNVSVEIEAGQLVLVCGPTGSGKSTLLKLVNGLAPHFTSGQLRGEILVDNVSIAHSKPNELAGLIGYVNQQPEGSFVADTVADEILFGMEQLGFEQSVMQQRLESIAQQTGLEDLLDRKLIELSGGQQQIVAIAAALSAGQKLLLLDEPTSALDQNAATRVIALLRQLIETMGITVVLAEHRIERVLDEVDSVVLVDIDGSLQVGKPEEVFRDYRLVPPVVQLGQKLGWQPLLLDLTAARMRLAQEKNTFKITERMPPRANPETALHATNLSVKYRDKIAVEIAELSVNSSEIVAIMGPNGAGKSSLLFELWRQNQEQISLVPQRASDLLFLSSLHLEFEESDRLAQVEPGQTAAFFTRLSQRVDPHLHPRDLSTGQQLALVLAIQLVKNQPIVLLDEPTGGLDYHAKTELADWLIDLRASGKAIVVASHDNEFIAACADRVIEIDRGRLVGEANPETLLDHRGNHKTQLAEVIAIDRVISLRQIEVSDV